MSTQLQKNQEETPRRVRFAVAKPMKRSSICCGRFRIRLSMNEIGTCGQTNSTRSGPTRRTVGRVHIEQMALIVENYDEAIRFFVDILGFELDEDSPSTTNDGRPKRWVVVRPTGAQTGLLLARADGPSQLGRRSVCGSGRAFPPGRRLRCSMAVNVVERGRVRHRTT